MGEDSARPAGERGGGKSAVACSVASWRCLPSAVAVGAGQAADRPDGSPRRPWIPSGRSRSGSRRCVQEGCGLRTQQGVVSPPLHCGSTTSSKRLLPRGRFSVTEQSASTSGRGGVDVHELGGHAGIADGNADLLGDRSNRLAEVVLADAVEAVVGEGLHEPLHPDAGDRAAVALRVAHRPGGQGLVVVRAGSGSGRRPPRPEAASRRCRRR